MLFSGIFLTFTSLSETYGMYPTKYGNY